uniref:Cyclin_C domain-containing protein n=1 Tax=Heterorhabditis bacteriophora TaxID=37862 RepID=A0A1I7XSL2_HETBA
MDLALLASSEFPMTDVYDRSLRRIIETRINPNLSATGKGPSINTVCRVLDMLSVCDLRCQSPSDRSILIFAICRLLLDRLSTCSIHQRASVAISNVNMTYPILNASSLSRRSVIVEFSRLFPLISDSILALRLCIECFRLSPITSSCILSLISILFIHISERAECEPADLWKKRCPDDAILDTQVRTLIRRLEMDKSYANLL